MAERSWVMPLVYLAVGLCAVGSGVWLHGSYFAVEPAPPPHAETPVETPIEMPPTLSRKVSFDGRALGLYYTEAELPEGLHVGFEEVEPAEKDQALRREYLLRIQDGKVVEGIELAAGWFHYLADVTGDGREELIVGEPELPEQLGWGLRQIQIHEVAELDYRPGEYLLGPRLLPVTNWWQSYDVYALGEEIRRLSRAGIRGSPRMSHADSFGVAEGPTRVSLASTTVYHQIWADLYGTGLPVYCKTEVESQLWRTEEGRRERVIIKRLVGTWEFDTRSGTFAWVDRHVVIPGEGKNVTSGDLQGLLRR